VIDMRDENPHYMVEDAGAAISHEIMKTVADLLKNPA
jgi:hypothetical protein